MFRKITSLFLIFGLFFQQVSFAQLAAELNMAGYLARINSGMAIDKFRPVHLRYFNYDLNTHDFKVLVDKGDLKNPQAPELENSTRELLNYFLVGVTLNNDSFWVNLRPDSQDQIIDPYLEQTEVGRVMLEADLQLKKDTAKLTSPETPEGKEYWNRLYKKAEEIYGFDNVNIPTLTRPWIVPGEIIIHETDSSAYIYKATLKVMLEQDYLANSDNSTIATNAAYQFKDSRSKALNEYSTQLIRELIIPKLTKEVNSSKRYANIRQVYYSLILSRWFKNKFAGQSGGYASRINTLDLAGLTSQESWSKTTYFREYQKSFKDGEYNIKEPVYTPTGQVIRSYFSGGTALQNINVGNGFIAGAAQILPKAGEFLDGNADKTELVSSPLNLRNTSVSGSPVTSVKISREEEISKKEKELEELNKILSQSDNLEVIKVASKHRQTIIEALGFLKQGSAGSPIKAKLEPIEGFLAKESNPPKRIEAPTLGVFFNEAGEKLVPITKFNNPELGVSKFEFRHGEGEMSLVKAILQDENGTLYVSPFGNDNNIYKFSGIGAEIELGSSDEIPKAKFISELKELRDKLKQGAAGSPMTSLDDFNETIDEIISVLDVLSQATDEQSQKSLKQIITIIKPFHLKFRGDKEKYSLSNAKEYLDSLRSEIAALGLKSGEGEKALSGEDFKMLEKLSELFYDLDHIYASVKETAAGSPITAEQVVAILAVDVASYTKPTKVDGQPETEIIEDPKVINTYMIMFRNVDLKILKDAYKIVSDMPASPGGSFQEFLLGKELGILGKVISLRQLEAEKSISPSISSQNTKLAASFAPEHPADDMLRAFDVTRDPYAEYDTAGELVYRHGYSPEDAERAIATATASSAVEATETSSPLKKGGIDFRSLHMTIKPMGSFEGLNLKLPQLSSSALVSFNLDEEIGQLNQMISGGIIPSGGRVQELVSAAIQKGELAQYQTEILTILAETCKLQEGECCEASDELKVALVAANAV